MFSIEFAVQGFLSSVQPTYSLRELELQAEWCFNRSVRTINRTKIHCKNYKEVIKNSRGKESSNIRLNSDNNLCVVGGSKYYKYGL